MLLSYIYKTFLFPFWGVWFGTNYKTTYSKSTTFILCVSAASNNQCRYFLRKLNWTQFGCLKSKESSRIKGLLDQNYTLAPKATLLLRNRPTQNVYNLQIFNSSHFNAAFLHALTMLPDVTHQTHKKEKKKKKNPFQKS